MNENQTEKTTEQSEILLRAEDITRYFPANHGKTVHAVNGVSFEIYRGETLAVVGESGCGKSTLARVLLCLMPPTSGKVYWKDSEITGMHEREFNRIRRNMQMVFQDPHESLNPYMKVRDIIAEPLQTYRVCTSKNEITERVLDLMERTGVPGDFLQRYPHQFSGGQRQRIGIARAIALDPELLVLDEPVSALDVSVQSQILNLLKHLKEEMNLTSLFIGHDLSVVYFIADRVAVMFLGKICEIGPKEELYKHPRHPYTAFLLDAIPQADPHLRDRKRNVLEGEIPGLLELPKGCCFHSRCPYATAQCCEEEPPMRDYGGGHMAACHNADI